MSFNKINRFFGLFQGKEVEICNAIINTNEYEHWKCHNTSPNKINEILDLNGFLMLLFCNRGN